MTSGRVRTRLIVAPLERLAAEVVGGQVVALDVRAHRAVVHEHAGRAAHRDSACRGREVGGLDVVAVSVMTRDNENGPDA